MAVFQKRSGAPSGAINLEVGENTYLIDDTSHTTITVTDDKQVHDLLLHPYLQLVGGSYVYTPPTVVESVFNVNGELSVEHLDGTFEAVPLVTGPPGPPGIGASFQGFYSSIVGYSLNQAVLALDANWYISLSNSNTGHDPTNPANQGVWWSNVNGPSVLTRAVQDVRINEGEIDLCRPWSLNGGAYSGSGVSPGQDVTTQLQNAINGFAAQGTGGTIFFSKPGQYLLNGPQQTGTAFGYSYTGQILFPPNAQTGPHFPIRIQGCGPTSSIGGDTSLPNGVTLYSNPVTPLTNTQKVMDVIPGASVVFSAVCPILKDINILMPNDPQGNGIDFNAADKCAIEGVVNIYTGPTPATSLTGTTNFGLRMPRGSNAGQCTSDVLVVQGFPIGLVTGEHAQFLGYTTVANCITGIKGGGGHIPNYFANLNTRGNINAFGSVLAADAGTYEGIIHIEAEGLSQQMFLNDIANTIQGHIKVHATAYGPSGTGIAPSGTFASIGGQHLDVEYVVDGGQATNQMIFPGINPTQGSWMNNHPADNFCRVVSDSAPAAGFPGQACPTAHPWIPQSGSCQILQAQGSGCTITIANPAVITSASPHNLVLGDGVKFTPSVGGALPTGLAINTVYYVTNIIDASNFSVSTTQAGTAVVTSGSQSGTPSFVPTDPHGTLTSTTSSGTSRQFLIAKRGGQSRTINMRFTPGASQNLALNAHFLVGGANGNSGFSAKVTGGTIIMGAGVNVTAAQTVTAGNTYVLSVAVDVGAMNVPTRVRFYLYQVNSPTSVPQKIGDFALPPSTQLGFLPINSAVAYPAVYDGFTYTSDTLTKMTKFWVTEGTPSDGNPWKAQTFPAYPATSGGHVTIDAQAAGLHTVVVNDANPFTVDKPINAPNALVIGGSPVAGTTSTMMADLTIEIYNDTAGAMGAITWASGAGGFQFDSPVVAPSSPGAGQKVAVTARWNGVRWHVTSASTAAYTQ